VECVVAAREALNSEWITSSPTMGTAHHWIFDGEVCSGHEGMFGAGAVSEGWKFV